MVTPVKQSFHHRGDKNCNHDECRYIKHSLSELRVCSECMIGYEHCSEIDWTYYDYGSGKGPVFFETVCDYCGIIDRDDNMPKPTGKINIKFERRGRLIPTDNVRLKAFKGF